jgi:transcription initiation factor TFIID subunit 1
MSAPFSILDAVYASDPDTPNIMKDFDTAYTGWAQVRTHSTRPRRPPTLQCEPDQQQLPYVQKPKRSTQPAVAAAAPDEPIAPVRPHFFGARFSLTNERSPQICQIHPPAQAERPPPSPPLPTQWNEETSIEELALIAAESTRETTEARQRDQNMWLDHRGGRPPTPIIPIFAKAAILKPTAECRPMNMIDTYFNQALCEGRWSVMWDPARCETIPLILDRSDRYILFTDRLSQGSQAPKVLREWNSMGFEGKNPFYGELKVNSFVWRDLNAQHSDPAINLYLIDPILTSVDAFHRPRLSIAKKAPAPVLYRPDTTPKSTDGMVVSTHLRDAQSLSGIEGMVFVIEQTSEWPVFILNVGMGSRLITFWHKGNAEDVVDIQDDAAMHVLEPNQGSPFMAKLPYNQSIPALVCSLFRVPLAKHEVPATDFLLVRPSTRSGFFIRRITAVYLAGMIEPHGQVMQPNTNDTRDFQKNFIKALIINIFRGTSQVAPRSTVQISQIREEFFPDVGETKLRGILKKFSDFSRGSTPPAWCRRANFDYDGEFMSARITPEQVCEYQSMLFGLLRLRRDGVNVLTSFQRMTNKSRALPGAYTTRIVEKIEFALMRTPWAKTANVRRAFEERPVEMVEAEDGEHVMRGANRRNRAGEPPSTKVAKTDADLRGLRLWQVNEKLQEFGIPQAEINSRTRWQRVALLRDIATRHASEGGESTTNLYARGPRNQYQASLQKYKEQYQSAFNTALECIRAREAAASFDDGADLLDSIAREFDSNSDDDDALAPAPQERRRPGPAAAAGDHACLVPFGVATHPTRIDWEALGFRGAPRRPVVKIIRVVFVPKDNNADGEDFLDVRVVWRRSPLLLRQLRELPAVDVVDGKRPDIDGDFEGFLLRQKSRALSEKINRLKTAKKDRERTKLDSVLAPDFAIAQEVREGELRFVVDPETREKITAAAAAFRTFDNANSLRRKAARGKKSDDVEDSEKPAKRKVKQRKDPLVELNKLLGKVAHRTGELLSALGKKAGKLRKNTTMSISLVRKKCHRKEYGGLKEFERDVAAIKDVADHIKAAEEWAALDECIRKEINAIRGAIEKVDPSARRK